MLIHSLAYFNGVFQPNNTELMGGPILQGFMFSTTPLEWSYNRQRVVVQKRIAPLSHVPKLLYCWILKQVSCFSASSGEKCNSAAKTSSRSCCAHQPGPRNGAKVNGRPRNRDAFKSQRFNDNKSMLSQNVDCFSWEKSRYGTSRGQISSRIGTKTAILPRSVSHSDSRGDRGWWKMSHNRRVRLRLCNYSTNLWFPLLHLQTIYSRRIPLGE